MSPHDRWCDPSHRSCERNTGAQALPCKRSDRRRGYQNEERQHWKTPRFRCSGGTSATPSERVECADTQHTPPQYRKDSRRPLKHVNRRAVQLGQRARRIWARWLRAAEHMFGRARGPELLLKLDPARSAGPQLARPEMRNVGLVTHAGRATRLVIPLAYRGLECRAVDRAPRFPLRPLRSNLYLPAAAFVANKVPHARDMNHRQCVRHLQFIEAENPPMRAISPSQ
jgi:hypothetical protein